MILDGKGSMLRGCGENPDTLGPAPNVMPRSQDPYHLYLCQDLLFHVIYAKTSCSMYAKAGHVL